MRIVNTNLNYTTAWTSENLSRTVELLRTTRADVIAIQECPSKKSLNTLTNALGFKSVLYKKSKARFFTALLWDTSIQNIRSGDTYAEQTWHGYTTATLHRKDWPCPVTFLSVHLSPFSVGHAVEEAQLLQSRLRRGGWPGVFLGDINHLPLVGPEPDWSQVPLHNRASRTVLNQDRPDELVGDRRVGLVFTRGGLVDVAAHRYQATGNESLLEPTGVHGRVRVDQCWVTGELTPAINEYTRLDHQQVTDHHPIQIDLDLESLDPIRKVEFH